MNENYIGGGLVKAQCMDVKQRDFSVPPTVGENIDNRIKRLQQEIDQLKEVKSQLALPNGLLNVSIEALQTAMRY